MYYRILGSLLSLAFLILESLLLLLAQDFQGLEERQKGGMVEERSCGFEGEPEGSLEQQEVRMPA